MPIEVDLTNGGVREGMLVVTTSTNVPGKRNNEIIYIAKVELSHPFSSREEAEKKSYDGNLYKKIIATTSEGARFVWKDQTCDPRIANNARQYGSALYAPMHWGYKEWKAMFE